MSCVSWFVMFWFECVLLMPPTTGTLFINTSIFGNDFNQHRIKLRIVLVANIHQMKCSRHTDIISIEIKCTAERALNCCHVMWMVLPANRSILITFMIACGKMVMVAGVNESKWNALLLQTKMPSFVIWLVSFYSTIYIFVFNCLILFVKQSSVSE